MQDPNHLLRVLLTSVRDAVVAMDDTTRVLLFNSAAEALTGWTEAEALGQRVDQLFELRENGSGKPISNLLQAIPNEAVCARPPVKPPVKSSTQALLRGKNGRRVAIEFNAFPLGDSEGGVSGTVIVFYDLGESMLLAERMSYQAQHDSVTGLPNRILLVDRLEQAAKVADRNSDRLAVISVELDSFNGVHTFSELRESIGSAADDLLREVAYRFNESLRESDTVCRLSGMEFVILLPGITSLQDTETLAAKLLRELGLPYSLANQSVQIAAISIGVSIYPTDASDVPTLMRKADVAMSQAHRAGRNQYAFAGQEIYRTSATGGNSSK